MENKKPNKIVNEMMQQVSPYLQNAAVFYSAAIAVGLLTFIFITWPLISKHIELSDQVAQNQSEIVRKNNAHDALYDEYQERKARVEKSNSEVKDVFEKEVLPSDENTTELVRYLERKVAELNLSEKENISLHGVSFGKALNKGDYKLINAKLTLSSNVDNFYRFLQVLESSGMKVGISDVKDFGLAYNIGLRDGDVITAIYKEGEKPNPAIIPSVISEKILALKEGDIIHVDVSRYSNINRKWQDIELAYELLASDTNEKNDTNSIGATLDLDKNYGRLISVDKVATKISEDEKNLNAPEVADFSLEISAYYLPAGK